MTSCDRCIAIYGENDPRVEPGIHHIHWGVRTAYFCTHHFNQITDPDPSGATSEPEYPCPVCHGLGVPMGVWGKLTWMRCRNCGEDFYAGTPPQSNEGASEQNNPSPLIA